MFWTPKYMLKDLCHFMLAAPLLRQLKLISFCPRFFCAFGIVLHFPCFSD